MLSPRIPAVADLRRVNDRYFQNFGADPSGLGIRYDLDARPGKYPVAFTDFGSRPRWTGGRLVPGEPWAFAGYLHGGLDNLAELLHETGHAIHIAAIRTRPAYVDWPDNDTFTEALADLPAMEVYEPAWQLRFLGDSAPLTSSLRARYAGIVFDMAWALFELRTHRAPGADPNSIWTDITRDYLGVRPHPEWSWWAMRGQLVDGPGYLINYALGAYVVADMRAAIRAARGTSVWSAPGMYDWLTQRLYRFGLERPSRQVLEDLLGRPLRPEALLADLDRLGS
jgi:oligoendopeptidase F